MKMTGLFILLFIIICAASYTATVVSMNNGMPDIIGKYRPETEQEKQERLAREQLEAPFARAENMAQPVQIDPEIEYDPLGDNIRVSETLDIPHRHEAAVSAWVNEHISKALTFRLQDYTAHQNGIAAFMSANGVKEFLSFLETANVLALMQSGNYDIRGSVLDIPELKTAGVAGGRYRWVYDVPTMLTFLPGDLTTYIDQDESTYQSESLVFRIQIARAEEDSGVDGLVIETWDVLKRVEE